MPFLIDSMAVKVPSYPAIATEANPANSAKMPIFVNPGRCGRSRPAGLPIVLPTRCETIVNLKAAKSRGIAIATGILLRAREAIGRRANQFRNYPIRQQD